MSIGCSIIYTCIMSYYMCIRTRNGNAFASAFAVRTVNCNSFLIPVKQDNKPVKDKY